MLPDADGRIPRPDPIWFRNDDGFCGLRAKISELNARSQQYQGGLIRSAFDMDKVGFRQLVLRIADPVLQCAVVGQHDQPLAVRVQATGRINAGNQDEVLQRGFAS